MPEPTGYEKCAHLYDLSDRKENIEFFHRCAATAGEILDIGDWDFQPFQDGDLLLIVEAVKREAR